jgi:hypothetical protein
MDAYQVMDYKEEKEEEEEEGVQEVRTHLPYFSVFP